MSSGQFELKNGNLFVLAEAAGGVYNGSQLRLICDVADDVSVFLKVTEDQRIGFMVPKDKLLELHAKLSKSGILLKHYRNHSIISPKACLGELCTKCEQDALGDAIEISPMLNEKFKESFHALNIGMNGCAIACVASATDDIHVIGESNGYRIFIGGKTSNDPKLAQDVADGIPRPKIGDAIANILDTYSQNKQENETLSDVVARLSLNIFKESLQKENLSNVTDVSGENKETTESSDDVAAVPLTESPLEDSPVATEPNVVEEEPALATDSPIKEDNEAALVADAPLAEESVSSELKVDSSEVEVEVSPEISTEEAPLEVAGNEAVPSELTPDDPPLEAAGSEVPTETPIEEEAPLEVGTEDVSNEPTSEVASTDDVPKEEVSVSEEVSPAQEEVEANDSTEGEVPVREESMKDEEMTTNETPVDGGEVAPVVAASVEENPSAEMKDLDIVDDTNEVAASSEGGDSTVQEEAAAPNEISQPEETAAASPEPIDHGLGEDTSIQAGEIPPPSDEVINEEAAPGLDDDVKTMTVNSGNKTSIQVRGKYFMVMLSDGTDFRIPFKIVAEGKVFEMQIEDETFIIENMNGKLQVKYGDMEMHVPLNHASASGSDESDSAA